MIPEHLILDSNFEASRETRTVRIANNLYEHLEKIKENSPDYESMTAVINDFIIAFFSKKPETGFAIDFYKNKAEKLQVELNKLKELKTETTETRENPTGFVYEAPEQLETEDETDVTDCESSVTIEPETIIIADTIPETSTINANVSDNRFVEENEKLINAVQTLERIVETKNSEIRTLRSQLETANADLNLIEITINQKVAITSKAYELTIADLLQDIYNRKGLEYDPTKITELYNHYFTKIANQ